VPFAYFARGSIVLSFLEQLIFSIFQFGMGGEIFGIMLDFHARIDGWLDYLLHGYYLGEKEKSRGDFSYIIK